MENNDLISRNDAINAVSSLMPSLTTPDGTGSNDNEIISAQEMCFDALQALHELPTVDAAPVVHGRWNVIVGNGWVDCKCNKCNHDWCGEEPPNYCENCGAHMDGKDDENENTCSM